MADTFTSLLRLVLQETGGNQNIWGGINNASAIELLEDAIAARLDLDVTPAIDPVTLLSENGALDQSRNAIIALTGNPGGTRDIIVPSTSKLYIVSNETSPGFDMTIKTNANPGVVVSPGTRVAVVVDSVADDVFTIGSVATATETEAGILEVATQVETDAGVLDDKIVTPLKLNDREASESLTGIIAIADQAETDLGIEQDKAITPEKLEGRQATESLTGLSAIADQAEVDAGIEDTKFVTSLKLATKPGGIGVGVSGAKAFGSANQAIATGASLKQVAFNSEGFDTGTPPIHDNAVNNSRLVVPTGVTRIRLTGYVKWQNNGSSFRRLKIRKNGAVGTIDDDQAGFEPDIFSSAANASVPALGVTIDTGIIRAVATDFFELQVSQESGLSLNLLAGDYWLQMDLIE